jgi:hypothetical protein
VGVDAPTIFLYNLFWITIDMSIKICVLSNGERIIGDFYEVRDNFRKPIGYAIVQPQIISMTKVTPTAITTQQSHEPSFKVSFMPWNPFCETQFFKLNMSAVISINKPRSDIEEIYKEQFYVENFLSESIVDEPLEILNYDNSNR